MTPAAINKDPTAASRCAGDEGWSHPQPQGQAPLSTQSCRGPGRQQPPPRDPSDSIQAANSSSVTVHHQRKGESGHETGYGHATGSGTRVTATSHAGPRDGQTNKSAIVVSVNGHSESMSASNGPGSGQKTTTGTAETVHGQKGSVTSHCERSVEQERNSRDRERAQRRSSRKSRPHEGDERNEREQQRSLVDSPISRERDRRSRPAEKEEATREGSASTGDSCERDDPTTPTLGREEAAESPEYTEAEALAATHPPPPPLLPNGGRWERRPHKNPLGGRPPSPPNGHAPQKGGGGEAGLPKKPRRRAEWLEAQREGWSLKGVSYCAHYRGAILKTLPTAPQTNPYKCHKSCQQNI